MMVDMVGGWHTFLGGWVRKKVNQLYSLPPDILPAPVYNLDFPQLVNTQGYILLLFSYTQLKRLMMRRG